MHPTTSVSEFEVLRGLVAQVSEQASAVKDALGVLRLESSDRHGETRLAIQDLSKRVESAVVEVEKLKLEFRDHRHSVNTTLTTHALEIAQLKSRLDGFESMIAQLRKDSEDERNAIRRALDESNKTRADETKAIMDYMSKLADAHNKRDGEMTQVRQAVGEIAKELGISGRTDIVPTTPGEQPKLHNIETWARTSRTAQLIMAICVAIDIVYRTIIAYIPH